MFDSSVLLDLCVMSFYCEMCDHDMNKYETVTHEGQVISLFDTISYFTITPTNTLNLYIWNLCRSMGQVQSPKLIRATAHVD